MRTDRVVLFLVVAAGLTFSTGCVVPQPRGQGLYSHVQEPTTKTWYNLYLPVDYVKNNGRHPDSRQQRWPLVMTFHGMKPYDNALPQEREWEKQADIYGYIVCAPELETSDSFMEYPITREHSYVMDDRRNVIAIMDHVFATTLADPRRVLATSWSCGGYLAHYFANRFPDRFSCIATRLSNFSAKLMAEETVPLYRDRTPVAIFIGDGDFPACKTESEEAVAWYTARGFRVVRGKMIDNMGHRRIPQTAAAFFAEEMGITPLHPLEAAETVAQVQMTEYHPTGEMIARLSPPIGLELARSAMPTRNLSTPATPTVVPPTRDARPSPTSPQGRTVAYNNSSAGRQYPSDRKPAYDPNPNSEVPKPSAPKGTSPTESAPAKVASASPSQRGNWLTTPKVQPPAAPASAKPTANPQPRGPANSERSVASAAPAKSRSPVESKTPPKPAETKPAARQAAPASALASNTPTRRFTPTNAGSKSYDSGNTSKSPASAARVIDRQTGDDPTLDSVASGRPQGTVRARRVNVRLGGPAIGTSPHYLAYSADLPGDIANGADFLWMDNGVWIGDEARGVRILEAPGLHRISVLVVAKDNFEYRGSATVQVLDRGPTASTN
jgi:hypothetical protein